jgi:hypothetical protein
MHEGTSIMHVGEVSLGDVDHGWFRGYGSSAWDQFALLTIEINGLVMSCQLDQMRAVHVLPVMEQLAFLYRETYALLLE